MTFSFRFWLPLIASLLSAATPLAAQEKKPNIVVILADDLGYECLGCNGGTSYKTPNLDKLAATGMRFKHCYVQPLCTPTRVQMMTGLYNIRNYSRFGLLDPGATTFANLLKKAGYATGMVGKWQLGHGFGGPKMFGFDEYCLWQLTRRPPRYANPGLEINGKAIDYKNGEYGPDLVSDYALDFLARKKDQPFFLYYTMMLPHPPFQPTPDSVDWNPKAMGEKVNDDKKHFADNIAYTDKLVGKLIAKLDEQGLRDNTLVVFLGDNGTAGKVVSQMGDHSITGDKGKTTSAGMHVPLIVNWPKVAPVGKVSSDLVDSTDFLPTICAAAGAVVPAELKIDGRSFLPQLRGEKGSPREWMYCWYAPSQGKRVDVPKEFAATTRYKLYRTGKFFDYDRDPKEVNPLGLKSLDAAAAATRKLLQEALDRFKDARPAKYPQPDGKQPKTEGTQARAAPSVPVVELFDGKTLNGWHAVPRPAPRKPNAPEPADELYKAALTYKGKWEVKDGVLFGGQDGLRFKHPKKGVDWGVGGYLVTDEKYGDFELTIDARPDWPVDTGIYLRTSDRNQGFQVLIDHREDGGIGFIYGNGIGSFNTRPYGFTSKLAWLSGEKLLTHSITPYRESDGPSGRAKNYSLTQSAPIGKRAAHRPT